MRRNVWSSLRHISSGGGVAHLAKAIGNTLHTVGPMSQIFLGYECPATVIPGYQNRGLHVSAASATVKPSLNESARRG
jgi:hypothetical protein